MVGSGINPITALMGQINHRETGFQMAQTALIQLDNQPHNVLARVEQRKTSACESLRAMIQLYGEIEVRGKAQATIDAKARDLSIFVDFYVGFYGHDHPGEWYKSITETFIAHLLARGETQATVARRYASVRRLARWGHETLNPFLFGCPTTGVSAPKEPQGGWYGLRDKDVHRLMNAARTLRVRTGRGTDTGLRDHALMCALHGTGLRVDDVCHLTIANWDGRSFVGVLVKKTGEIHKRIAIERESRDVIAEWIAARGDSPGAIFCTRTGKGVSRRQAGRIVERIAAQANAHLPESERFTVTPHVFRHTFLRRLMEKKGLHYTRKASGNKSDRYIWRYVQPSEDELAQAVEQLNE